MPNNIIIDGAVTADQWHVVSSEATQIPAGAVIVPVTYWLENKAELSQRDSIGIWLNSDESPELIADDLEKFAVIAINFPAFADGRGFSYARELRDTHQYKGELRAVGEFIRDQLFYLKRCGFNAFALENTNIEDALTSLEDFSENYQADTIESKPLFQRR